jgi:antitoxin (DNA-binding transcriptional repressor) of toxin-antitoxin stability system
MSLDVTMEEAQAHLPELIDRLKPGEEVVIRKGDQVVARLTAELQPELLPREPGSAIGKLIVIAEDEEHLADFREYMR